MQTSNRQCSLLFSLLVITVVSLSACGGGGSTAGTQIQLSVATQTDNAIHDDTTGEVSFTNLEGTSITLQQALITVSSVELATDCTGSSFASLADELRHMTTQAATLALDWLVPPAAAHTANAPTRYGVPHIIDVLVEEVTMLGILSPPLGDYCGTRWQLAAADEDAIGVSIYPEMNGYSVRISGNHSGSQDASINPFTIDLSLAPLPAERLLQPLLELTTDTLSADLRVTIHYDRWFDGVDMAALESGSSAAMDLLIGNIMDNFVQESP